MCAINDHKLIAIIVKSVNIHISADFGPIPATKQNYKSREKVKFLVDHFLLQSENLIA